MKKILWIIVVLVMVASLAACAPKDQADELPATADQADDAAEDTADQEGEATEDPASEEGEATASLIPSDLPAMRIGFATYSTADKQTIQFINALEYIADDFNVEIVIIDSQDGGADPIAPLENALEKGLDGVIAITSETVAMADACKRAGDVPILGVVSQPSTEEGVQQLAEYENYLGTTAFNDYKMAAEGVEALYAAGVRNLAVIGIPLGMTEMHDQRLFGARDVAAKYDDMNIVAEDFDVTNPANAIAVMAAAYPEMDGIYATYGTEAMYQAMRTEGLMGQVKFATTVANDSTPEFFESGDIVSCDGGHYSTIMTAFAILYNYLYDGTVIIPDPLVPAEVCAWVSITNIEEYETYIKYFEGDIPCYTSEELAAFIDGFNPKEVTIQNYLDEAEAFSIELVAERHEDLL